MARPFSELQDKMSRETPDPAERLAANKEIGADCYALFERILARLCDCYDLLRRTGYTDRGLADATRTNALILAAGIRHLKAAVSNIEDGWEPEASVHIRAAQDAMIDLGFLLTHTREDRIRLSQQYVELRALRVATLRDVFKNHPERMSATQYEDFRLSQEKYEGSVALDGYTHWSGLERKDVRAKAHAYFDQELSKLGLKNITSTLQKTIYHQMGSASVHVDPSAHLFIPRDDREWPMIDGKEPDHFSSLGLCLITAVLFYAATRKVAEPLLKSAATDFIEEVFTLTVDRAAHTDGDAIGGKGQKEREE